MISCGQSADIKVEDKYLLTDTSTGEVVIAIQECEKCNLKVLSNFQENIENPSYDDYSSFICTFDEKCKSNAEFSEYANDLLYNSILTNPYFLNEALYNLGSDQFNLILNELENPVNDSYDLQLIYDTIKKLAGPREMVESEMKSILEAAKKSGIEIKE